MKGLLIKDINLLKSQKKFWIGIVVIAMVLLGQTENHTFAVTYMAIIAAMFVLNTMGYDEMQNGMSYLFTLPVSRRSYVREKYIFGGLISLFSVLAASGAAAVMGVIKHRPVTWDEGMVMLVLGLIMAMIVLAAALPLQVKFGMEKGRIALFAVYGGIFLLGAATKNLIPGSLPKLLARADWILENHPAAAVLAGCGIGILLVAFSYLLSLHFMKKKQF